MFRPEVSMAKGIMVGWTWQSFIFDPVFLPPEVRRKGYSVGLTEVFYADL
jgi:hypothetical protein